MGHQWVRLVRKRISFGTRGPKEYSFPQRGSSICSVVRIRPFYSKHPPRWMTESSRPSRKHKQWLCLPDLFLEDLRGAIQGTAPPSRRGRGQAAVQWCPQEAAIRPPAHLQAEGWSHHLGLFCSDLSRPSTERSQQQNFQPERSPRTISLRT